MPKIEIAMVHRVAKATRMNIGPYQKTTISPFVLERYLAQRQRWGKGHYGEELARTRDDWRSSILLTFDDGYRNNLTTALPILEKHHMPCIIFLVSGFIDREISPYEIILARFLESLQKINVPQAGFVELHTKIQREELYEHLRTRLKPCKTSFRQRYLRILASANDKELPPPEEEFLDWDEVRALDKHPLVTVGAHSHTHPVLTSLPVWQAYKEIKKSKNCIETMLGHPIECFSYPYGANSFIVRKLVKLAGFHYAFTTRSKRIEDPTRMNRLAIPRIDIKKIQIEGV